MDMTVLEVCGIIAIIGGAVGYLYKGYKALSKPHEEVNEKLSNDYEDIRTLERRLDDVEKDISELKEANKLIMKSLYQMLDHFETQNNTGGMRESKNELFAFLNK